MRLFLQGNVVSMLLFIATDAAGRDDKATTIRAFLAMMLAVAAADWSKA